MDSKRLTNEVVLLIYNELLSQSIKITYPAYSVNVALTIHKADYYIYYKWTHND